MALLILDPSTRTGPLDRALREHKGWQVPISGVPPVMAPYLVSVLCTAACALSNSEKCATYMTCIYICAAHPRALFAYGLWTAPSVKPRAGR